MKLDPVYVLAPRDRGLDPPTPPVPVAAPTRRGLLLGAIGGLFSAGVGLAAASAWRAAHAEPARAAATPIRPELATEPALRWARRLADAPLDELLRHAPGFVAALSLSPVDPRLRHGAVRLASGLSDTAPTREGRQLARALAGLLERLPRTPAEQRALDQLREAAR